MSRGTSNKLVRRLDSCLADKLSVGESNKVRDLLPVQKLAQLMLWNGNVDWAVARLWLAATDV